LVILKIYCVMAKRRIETGTTKAINNASIFSSNTQTEPIMKSALANGNIRAYKNVKVSQPGGGFATEGAAERYRRKRQISMVQKDKGGVIKKKKDVVSTETELIRAQRLAELEQDNFQMNFDQTIAYLHDEVPKLSTERGIIARSQAGRRAVDSGFFYKAGRVWDELPAIEQKSVTGFMDSLPIMRRNQAKRSFNAGSGNSSHPARDRLRQLAGMMITTLEDTTKVADQFALGLGQNAAAVGSGVTAAAAGVTNTAAGVTTTLATFAPVILVGGVLFIFVNRKQLGSTI
jgi:hypothetical protein